MAEPEAHVAPTPEEKKEEKPQPRFCITKEDLEKLPLGGFGGRIIVVSSPEGAERAAHSLSHSHMLGFDTETRPAFRRGERHPIALIQISTEDLAFLFRVAWTGMPPGLKHLLENHNIIKIGQGLKHELLTLYREQSVKGAGFIDLLDIAHKVGCQPMTVKAMTAMFLGIRISKAAQTSNWEHPHLSEKQTRYAATDAWACLMIHRELRQRGLIPQGAGKLR